MAKKVVKKAKKVENKVVKTCNACNKQIDLVKEVACMVFMAENQVARATAAMGLFLGDEINKKDLLEEWAEIDATMKKLSRDFHTRINEIVAKGK